jgi:hypothetical protein
MLVSIIDSKINLIEFHRENYKEAMIFSSTEPQAS